MDSDDGRLLSRREAVRLLGATGVAPFGAWNLAVPQAPAPVVSGRGRLVRRPL